MKDLALFFASYLNASWSLQVGMRELPLVMATWYSQLKNLGYNVATLCQQGQNILLSPRALRVRTNITAFKFQGAKKSCYTNLVKLKRVWKQNPNQAGCMHAAKQQQASLKVVPSLKNLHSLTSLNACTHLPWRSAALPEMHTGCTFPSRLLCAASRETRYCQAHGPDNKAPWHGGGGEGTGWKRKEKRRWRHRFGFTSGSWKGERNRDLAFRLGVRAENEKSGVGMVWWRN